MFFPKPDPAPHDIPLAKKQQQRLPTLRLTVLGTSLTANYDWPERMVDALAPRLGQRPHISRIALAGANSAWGLSQIPAAIVAKPDIVLIEFALNDADILDGVWLSESAVNHRKMILALQTALPETRIVLLTMSPAQGLRGLMRFRLGSYYRQYHSIAGETAVGLIDLYPRCLAMPGTQRGLDKDGLHPDPEIAAELIVPVITAYLRPALAGNPCQP